VEYQGTAMTKTKTLEQRLVAAAEKAGREREAAQAMREYQAERARIDANTARLRALRLAKEAADAEAAAAKPKSAPRKRAAKTATNKTKAAP
jgi:hypothetical protein